MKSDHNPYQDAHIGHHGPFRLLTSSSTETQQQVIMPTTVGHSVSISESPVVAQSWGEPSLGCILKF
jgi:hypothetical protein